MRQNLKQLILVQAFLSVCLAAPAKVADRAAERYENIPERNLFGLKAPPPGAGAAPAQAEAPTKIFLTGITTILGQKRVLLKEQPPAGKPAKPAADQSLILSEGQREGGVEVLQIDAKSGRVRINNSGVEQTLTFEKDGWKTPAAPARPAAPSPLPTTMSAPYPPPVQPGLSRHSLPSRAPRWPARDNSTAAAAPAATGSIFPAVPVPEAAPTPTGSASGLAEPALPGNTPGEIQNQLQPELSLEQEVMSELQQEGQQDNTGAVPGSAPASPAAPGVTTPGNAPANGLPAAPAVYPQ